MFGEGKILFYIVIGLAYYFYKTFLKESKREKEKHINSKPIDNKSAEEIFKRLLRTLEGKENETEKTIPETITEKPASVHKKSVYRSVVAKELMPEEPHLTESDRKIDHSYDDNNPVEKIVDLEQIDMRKAIIYSEIFTRPQY